MAGISGHVTDGMSPPYQIALVAGSWIYLLIGLLWLRRALLSIFNDGMVAVTLLLLLMGSNLFYMAAFDPLMPHVLLFAIYSGVVWHTIKWNEHGRSRDFYIVAVLIGVATIVRFTELILVIIPLLWGLGSPSIGSMRERIKVHRKMYLQGLVIVAIIFIPQSIYWLIATGQVIYDGYANAGEGLDLHRPHILEVLFSFRKGFFIYTPIMAFALVGCIHLYRQARSIVWAVIIFLLVYCWVASSWTIWWYADSFGNRGLLQSYAIIALPLASLITYIAQRSRSVKIIWSIIVMFFVVLNLFQTWQVRNGIMHTSQMTKAAYFAVFGRTEKLEHLEDLLVVERRSDGTIPQMDPARYRSIAMIEQPLSTPDPEWWTDRYVNEPFNASPMSFRIDAEVPWSPAVSVKYGAITDAEHLYADYSIHIFFPESAPKPEIILVFGMEHDGRQYGVVNERIDATGLIPGIWNRVGLRYLTPVIRSPKDKIRGFVWLRSAGPVWVDDGRMELFEQKEN